MAKIISIVDDMVSVRCALKLLLQGEKFELDEASNGKEAMALKFVST
jgi:CheY-like chemotaxis protein